jgi:hypothetical protein
VAGQNQCGMRLGPLGSAGRCSFDSISPHLAASRPSAPWFARRLGCAFLPTVYFFRRICFHGAARNGVIGDNYSPNKIVIQKTKAIEGFSIISPNFQLVIWLAFSGRAGNSVDVALRLIRRFAGVPSEILRPRRIAASLRPRHEMLPSSFRGPMSKSDPFEPGELRRLGGGRGSDRGAGHGSDLPVLVV